MLLLKLSLRPWRLSPYSQLFSAFAVGVLLLLAGILFWIQQGLKPVLTHLQQEQTITAYLSPSLDPQKENDVVNQIQLALVTSAQSVVEAGKARYAYDVKLTTADQFIDRIRKSYPELGRELEDLGSEMTSVVPRYVSISGMLGESAIAKIRAVPGVESAESSKDRNRSAISAFIAIRWVSEMLAAGLFLAVMAGLVHLSRTNSYLHHEALGLLRLLGAGSGSLRAPGIISGLCVGGLGGMIALLGWSTGGMWLSRQIAHLSPALREMPAAPRVGPALLVLGFALGLLAGLLGRMNPPHYRES